MKNKLKKSNPLSQEESLMDSKSQSLMSQEREAIHLLHKKKKLKKSLNQKRNRTEGDYKKLKKISLRLLSSAILKSLKKIRANCQ
jgi:hypothetical protein